MIWLGVALLVANVALVAASWMLLRRAEASRKYAAGLLAETDHHLAKFRDLAILKELAEREPWESN